MHRTGETRLLSYFKSKYNGSNFRSALEYDDDDLLWDIIYGLVKSGKNYTPLFSQAFIVAINLNAHKCIACFQLSHGSFRRWSFYMGNYDIFYQFRDNMALKVAIKMNNLGVVKVLLDMASVTKKISGWMLTDFFVANEAYEYFIGHSKVIDKCSRDIVLHILHFGSFSIIKAVGSLVPELFRIWSDDSLILKAAMKRKDYDIIKYVIDIGYTGDAIFLAGKPFSELWGDVKIVDLILKNIKIALGQCSWLTYILFSRISCFTDAAFVINLLVKYDIITKEDYNYRELSSSSLVRRIGLPSWNVINVVIDIDHDNLLEYLLWTFHSKADHFWARPEYRKSVNILAHNPKLNESYNVTLLVIMSRNILFEMYYIPAEIINLVVWYINNKLLRNLDNYKSSY